MLNRIPIFLGITVFFLFLYKASSSAATSLVVKGGKLPVINLPIPNNAIDKKYLGLSGNGYFKISKIGAQAVIIKIFNLYCPACQSIASAMNKVYRYIEDNPSLTGKIKLIGIGVGNSHYEMEVFKNSNQVLYPLFPDKDFKIHKTLGEVRTPYIIAIKNDGKENPLIVHTQLGGFTEPEPFIELMYEIYELEKKDLPQREENLTLINRNPPRS